MNPHVKSVRALDDYELALTFWDFFISLQRITESIGVPSKAIPESMIKDYPELSKFTSITKEPLLSIIWKSARKHLDKAAPSQ